MKTGTRASFRVHLTDIYSIAGVPNGGYIAAIAVKAAKATLSASADADADADTCTSIPMQQGTPYTDCLSITGQYHAATVHLQPADIATEVTHKGRTVASVAIQVRQTGRLKASFSVLLGDLASMSGIQVSVCAC